MTQNNKLPRDEGIKVIELTKADALAARSEYLAREQAFFDWWKKGVELAGYHYFGDGTKQGFVIAANKNDLRPVSEKITKSFGLIGNGEVAFLTAMYCFYNDIRGAELCASAGVKSIGALTGLDIARREVIAGLLISYCGW